MMMQEVSNPPPVSINANGLGCVETPAPLKAFGQECLRLWLGRNWVLSVSTTSL